MNGQMDEVGVGPLPSAGRRQLALIQEELLGGQGERRGGRPLEEGRERQAEAAMSGLVERYQRKATVSAAAGACAGRDLPGLPCGARSARRRA
jgi:hypothetical protein